MTEQELHSSICYQILRKAEEQFASLVFRWKDESEYEDFKDYREAFIRAVREAVEAHGFKATLRKQGLKLLAKVAAPDGASCTVSGQVDGNDMVAMRYTRIVPTPNYL